jgi:hypothetical protein
MCFCAWDVTRGTALHRSQVVLACRQRQERQDHSTETRASRHTAPPVQRQSHAILRSPGRCHHTGHSTKGICPRRLTPKPSAEGKSSGFRVPALVLYTKTRAFSFGRGRCQPARADDAVSPQILRHIHVTRVYQPPFSHLQPVALYTHSE